jgi:hypothetical protein
MGTKQERGIPYVRDRIRRSQDRISNLTKNNRLRDVDEIWEAYYDVEEAILISKIIFGGFDKPGKIRTLNIPTDFDFFKLSDSEIRAKFESVGKNLSLAELKLELSSGEETIESLRRARDEVKIMLLRPSKAPKKANRTGRGRRGTRS